MRLGACDPASGLPYAAPATVFASHAWKYDFALLLEALAAFAAAPTSRTETSCRTDLIFSLPDFVLANTQPAAYKRTLAAPLTIVASQNGILACQHALGCPERHSGQPDSALAVAFNHKAPYWRMRSSAITTLAQT